jgi:hypothetical protein
MQLALRLGRTHAATSTSGTSWSHGPAKPGGAHPPHSSAGVCARGCFARHSGSFHRMAHLFQIGPQRNASAASRWGRLASHAATRAASLIASDTSLARSTSRSLEVHVLFTVQGWTMLTSGHSFQIKRRRAVMRVAPISRPSGRVHAKSVNAPRCHSRVDVINLTTISSFIVFIPFLDLAIGFDIRALLSPLMDHTMARWRSAWRFVVSLGFAFVESRTVYPNTPFPAEVLGTRHKCEEEVFSTKERLPTTG